jgi:tetratricopeptide (TPR) repeat protein
MGGSNALVKRSPQNDARIAPAASSTALRSPVRSSRYVALLILAAAVLAVFGRSFTFPFLRWDDPTAVTENILLHPPSWRNLATIWSAPWSGLYVPLSFTVYWIEMHVSALLTGQAAPDARVFHAGLLLLHTGCALLVFRILRRLVADERAALCGALLFAIHPLQAESALWITETRGVLATLFGLAALDVYLAGALRAAGPSFLRHHVLSTLLFALALLSKPTAAAIPLIAFSIDRFHLRRPIARMLPILATWIAVVLLDVWLTRSQQGGASIHYTTPWAERPFVALDALGFYLAKLAWPFDLAADYGRKPEWLLAQSGYRLHALPVLALACVLAFLPRRATWLLALALFVAALSPVLGLLPFDYQAISTVADRYAHLALLGPAFALAALMARFPNRSALISGTALLAVLGLLAGREAGRWRDTQTLFRRTLEINPQSHVACVQLGVVAEEAGNRDEGADWYKRALALEPGYPVAATNLARIYMERGQLDEAIPMLRETARRDPDFPFAAQKLAIALAQRGTGAPAESRARDFQEAESVLRALLARQPGFPGGHLTLGQILLAGGRTREALEEFAWTLELAQNSAEAHRGMARCYAKLGDRERAEQHARKAAALSGQ